MALIEFYLGSDTSSLASVKDGAVPREGEYVNIRQVIYRVIRVTWAVDHADDVAMKQLRANVEVEAVKPAARRPRGR